MYDRRLIEGLLSADAYPHPVGDIRLEETHISWVLLTGDYVYKIKKPVDLGFLDFRSLERRRFFCDEELRLNRNWAPSLYLDVVPVVLHGGKPRIGGAGTPVEFAVKMHQFDSAMRLDRQMHSGQLNVDDVREMASEIAARHLAAQPVPPADRWLDITLELIRDNYDALAGEVPAAFLSAQRRWMDERLARYEKLMVTRAAEGFVRDCHGDLHLGNLVRLPEGIRAFDCIEFSRDLRQIDVVADYAFLTMDLKARGSGGLASVFLNRYLEITGDYAGAALLPLYEVYRCLVRAKILALRRHQNGQPGSRHGLRRYSALARCLVRHWPPALVAMHGYSGSGKSWLSDRLLRELPAIRLRSDLERKRLAGLDATARSGSAVAGGIYRPAATAAVYDHLLSRAAALLEGGMNVIIDASFLNAGHRDQARQTAAGSGAAFVVISTVAPEAELRERLRRRNSVAEVSEADLAVLQHQFETADAVAAEETEGRITVDTSTSVDVDAIAATIRRLNKPPR